MAAARLTVAGLFGRYIAANRKRLAPSTIGRMSYCFRAFLEWCPVDDPAGVTARMVGRYAERRERQGRVEATIRGELLTLRSVFRQAVADGLLERNPFDVLDGRKGLKELMRDVRKRPRVLTDDEIDRLLRAARGTVWHDVIYFLLRTGLSRRELARLRWEEVDFEARVIRAGGRGLQIYLKPRSIPMDDELARVIARQPGGPTGEDVTPALARLTPWRAGTAGPDHSSLQAAGAPPEMAGEEDTEEEESDRACKTFDEVLDRAEESIDRARRGLDPRIVRVERGLEELGRRSRTIKEGRLPPDVAGEGSKKSEEGRRLRVVSWLLDSFGKTAGYAYLCRPPSEGDRSNRGGHPFPGSLNTGARRALSDPRRAAAPYVFATALGGPRWRNVDRNIGCIAAKAGLGPVTPITLRHTFGAHLVMNGVDRGTLRTLMGFGSYNKIDIYSEFAPGGRIPKWYVMSHAGDELARRMRAAVEGFRPPLPGPTAAEVIHRVANVLEEVVGVVARQQKRRRKRQKRLRQKDGLARCETLVDLVLWLEEKEKKERKQREKEPRGA